MYWRVTFACSVNAAASMFAAVASRWERACRGAMTLAPLRR